MTATDVLLAMPPEVVRLTAGGDGPWTVTIYLRDGARKRCAVPSSVGSGAPADATAYVLEHAVAIA